MNLGATYGLEHEIPVPRKRFTNSQWIFSLAMRRICYWHKKKATAKLEDRDSIVPKQYECYVDGRELSLCSVFDTWRNDLKDLYQEVRKVIQRDLEKHRLDLERSKQSIQGQHEAMQKPDASKAAFMKKL